MEEFSPNLAFFGIGTGIAFTSNNDCFRGNDNAYQKNLRCLDSFYGSPPYRSVCGGHLFRNANATIPRIHGD